MSEITGPFTLRSLTDVDARQLPLTRALTCVTVLIKGM